MERDLHGSSDATSQELLQKSPSEELLAAEITEYPDGRSPKLAMLHKINPDVCASSLSRFASVLQQAIRSIEMGHIQEVRSLKEHISDLECSVASMQQKQPAGEQLEPDLKTAPVTAPAEQKDAVTFAGGGADVEVTTSPPGPPDPPGPPGPPHRKKHGMQLMVADALRPTRDGDMSHVILELTGGEGDDFDSDEEEEDRKDFKPCTRNLMRWASWWDALEEPERSGPIFEILNSRWFSMLSTFVVLLQAAIVTTLSDYSLRNIGAEPPAIYDFIELGFLCFYLVELVLGLICHRQYFYIGENSGWNTFDSLLVLVNVIDLVVRVADKPTKQSSGENVTFWRILRLLRLAKILRTLRVLRVFQELSMMLESFKRCTVTMLWGFVLLVFLLFLFALTFAQGVATYFDDHSPAEDELRKIDIKFGTVLRTMITLYMAVTGGFDWSEVYFFFSDAGVLYQIMFLFYTFFSVFAIFNILTGIFVDRAMAVALPDTETIILDERMKIMKRIEEFRGLWKNLDIHRVGTITKQEFLEHMKDKRMVAYMSSMGLELHDVGQFFRFIAGGETAVDAERFIEGCLCFQGVARSVDAHRQMAVSKELMDKMNELCSSLDRAFEKPAECFRV